MGSGPYGTAATAKRCVSHLEGEREEESSKVKKKKKKETRGRNVVMIRDRLQLGGGNRERRIGGGGGAWGGLDGATYPGTLGRFLTVQVLCHLGHRESSH